MTGDFIALKAYRNEAGTLVELIGGLKLQNCAEVKARLLGLLQNGSPPVFLHLGQLSELDSAGLGVLVGLHMSAQKEKIDLQMLAPTEFVLKLMTATRLVSLLRIVQGNQAESIYQSFARPENAIPLPSV